MTPKRRVPDALRTVLWSAVGAVALVFAIQGGEYSTLDLVRQYRQTVSLRAQIDSLQFIVDSLGHYRDRVLHDPATQERIGREEFGWVRGDREMLYRFEAPDTAGRGKL